jgi:hypothetical protein
VFLCPLFFPQLRHYEILAFLRSHFNRRDFPCLLRYPSNGCSAISAAKSPKSSTSLVSSSSYYFSFSFGSAVAAGSLKVLLQRFFEAPSSTIVPSAGTTAMGTNPAILIMVAIGRSELLS